MIIAVFSLCEVSAADTSLDLLESVVLTVKFYHAQCAVLAG